MNTDTTFKRLHPIKLVYDILNFLKNNLIAIIILFVFNFDTDSTFMRVVQIIYMVVIIITLITQIPRWFTYRYQLNEQAVMERTGMFTKTERSIPLHKIQNVQRHANMIHKMLGVTSLVLETADEGEGSIHLDVVTKKEALAIEEYALGQRKHTEAEVEDERMVHFKPSNGDLIKASITSLQFFFIIPVVLKMRDVIPFDKWFEGRFANIPFAWLLLLICFGIVVAFIVGVIKTFKQYGNYMILSDDERIYVQKGILSESALSIQKKRVQAIEISQSIVQQLLRTATIKLVISSGVNHTGETELNELFPYLPKKRAFALVHELLPNYTICEGLQRLPKVALIVSLLRPSYLWLFVTIAIGIWKVEWWPASIVLLALVVISRVLKFVQSGYLLEGDTIQMKEGGFSTTMLITKRPNVIEVKVEQGFLQQRVGIATIEVVNRGKHVHHQKLLDVPEQLAGDFYYWYKKRRGEVNPNSVSTIVNEI